VLEVGRLQGLFIRPDDEILDDRRIDLTEQGRQWPGRDRDDQHHQPAGQQVDDQTSRGGDRHDHQHR
jgi:hypothetical protein